MRHTFSRQVEALVDKGQFNFGTYPGAIRNLNFLDAKSPYDIPLPSVLLGTRLKEWQALQLGNEDYFIMVVLYNAKTLALIQCKVFDKRNQQKYIYEKILPPWDVSVPATLFNCHASYESTDFNVKMHNDIESGRIEVSVNIQNQKDLPNLHARWEGFHDAKVSPIVASLPFAKNRGMYSHKCLMPMQGKMNYDKEQVIFNRADSFMIIDHHKGFYPFEMKYDWVTGVRWVDGHLVGFNLTDNQALDPEKYNENCFWYDGDVFLLPAIKITRPNGIMADWFIKDKFGMVDLVFHPKVDGIVDIDLFLLKSDYRGPYGYFEGTLKSEDNTAVNVADFFGMGEKIFLRA